MIANSLSTTKDMVIYDDKTIGFVTRTTEKFQPSELAALEVFFKDIERPVTVNDLKVQGVKSPHQAIKRLKYKHVNIIPVRGEGLSSNGVIRKGIVYYSLKGLL